MAASDRTHYDVLGISRDADASAVRSAWKLHVQAWHPDRFGEEQKPEAERQTALINEAYSVLRDSSRRAAYDCRLAADELAAQPEPAPVRRTVRAASRQPMRPSAAPVGSPMAVAAEPATLGEQLSTIGADALRSMRRHPKLVASIAAAWVLVVGGGIVASAMTGPSVPATVKAAPSTVSVVTDQSQAEDLEQLAQQAQAESAATDEAIRRMQEEDARLAALDAAAARKAASEQARAEALARKQGKQAGGGARDGGRVIRVMPSGH
jgi:curved DNA-binding protein CbpA